MWQTKGKANSCIWEGAQVRVASICKHCLSEELLRVLEELRNFLLWTVLLTSSPLKELCPFKVLLNIATLGSKVQHGTLGRHTQIITDDNH